MKIKFISDMLKDGDAAREPGGVSPEYLPTWPHPRQEYWQTNKVEIK